ncbi:ABC transporter substrate-binding protein [Fulvimarina endophytica]|uniref:ABC transporter substrate-binding protein n=1 Tax=Fulvimarina endophytica TaxID=2293836 RepID=A0A371X0J3_9HYPH|nr:substrate-binding domain-containing protein [Fulvimarina endophytica]RFC62763.1 ABC transporter substrate-binding protein [Fulvimarina endophytica]
MTLNLMSTLAVEVALKRNLLPSFIETTGIALDVSWNPTKVIMQRIADGRRADALVLIDKSMAELVEKGIVVADSVRPIATAKIGIAMARGADRPAIESVDEFKGALLKARSVAYSRAGASGIYFADLIERLGIADAVNEKATVIPEGFTARQIVEGKADLAIQQISELMSVEDVDILGPLPADVQSGTDFSVAIFADAEHAREAARLVQHLTSPEAARAYEASGLTSRLSNAPAN